MKSKFEVWIVGWAPQDAKDWSEPTIKPLQPIGTEPVEPFKVRCAKVGCKDHGKKGWHYGDILAVFSTEEEAKVWSEKFGWGGSFHVYPANLTVRDK